MNVGKDLPPDGFEDRPPDGFEEKTPSSDQSSGVTLGNTANLGINMVRHPLETLAAPFEATGEAIRTGVTGAIDLATGQPISKDDQFRAPTILQRSGLAQKTSKPPADPFEMGATGIQALSRGAITPLLKGAGYKVGTPLEEMNKEVQRPKDQIMDIVNQLGLAFGTGRAGNAPIEAISEAIKIPLNAGAGKFGPWFVKKAPEWMARMGINKTAAKIVVNDPELLKNPSLGNQDSLNKVSNDAFKTMNSHISQEKKANEGTAIVSQKLIESGVSKMRAGLENEVETAKAGIETARTKSGVAVSQEQRAMNVLHPGLPALKTYSTGEIAQELNSLKSSIGKLKTQEGIRRIFELRSGLESNLNRGNLNKDEEIFLHGVNSQISDLFSKVPGNPKEKLSLIDFYTDKTVADQLTKKFNTPGLNPSLQEITLQSEFIKNNTARLSPKEQAQTILSTRSAIDEFEINYAKNGLADSRTTNYIKTIRGDLDRIMKRLPGFEKVNDADASYSMAMTMANKLDKALDGPRSFETFLKNVFEDVGGKKSNENLAALQSLEEKMDHNGLVATLHREYQTRDSALKAKIPFDSEFSSPADSQKFLRGLFHSQEADPVARENLEKLKKIPGMGPVVDETFKNLSVELFRSKPVMGNWERRAMLAEPIGLIMYPFSHGLARGMATGGILYGLAMRMKYPTFWAKMIKGESAISQFAKTGQISEGVRKSLLIGSRIGRTKDDNE